MYSVHVLQEWQMYRAHLSATLTKRPSSPVVTCLSLNHYAGDICTFLCATVDNYICNSWLGTFVLFKIVG